MFYDQPFPTYFKGASNVGPPFGTRADLRDIPQGSFPNAWDFVDLDNPVLGGLRPVNYTGTTYGMQYNLTIQSEIAPGTGLTFGYTGSQGRKLFRTGQMNIKFPTILADGRQCFNFTRDSRRVRRTNDLCPDGPTSRRNRAFGNIRMQSTDANSNYNALLVNIEKRLGAGLRFQGAYTFSKTMSYAEAVFGSDFVAGGEHQVVDPYNPKLDRAEAGFSLKHNFTFNYSYELPFVLEGAVGKILNGWQVSGITSITSGAPLPANSSCCSQNGSSGSSRAERPNLIGSNTNPITGVTAGCGSVPVGQKLGTPDLYFDPCAFENGPDGFYGNLGRNTIIGPGLVIFDFSLMKNTAITEGTSLQVRAEFFNLFNRPNFGTPEKFVFTSSARRVGDTGRITDTSTTSRQIQFGLKLIF